LPDNTPTLLPGNAVRVQQLREILQFLTRGGWNLVPMGEIPARLRDNSSRKFLAITLDDGQRDNLDHGWPVFREFNAPFTVYVVTGFLNRTHYPWHILLETLLLHTDTLSLLHPEKGPLNIPCSSLEEKTAVLHQIEQMGWKPGELSECLVKACQARGLDVANVMNQEFCSWTQLRELSDDPLVTVGVHTISHPRLSELSEEEAAREISASRAELVKRLGTDVDHIAYPFGSPQCCGPREFQMVERMGFRTGVTTSRGNLHARHRDTLFSLPRHTLSMAPHSSSVRYLRISLNGIWDSPMNGTLIRR
jgi:peptidoglycan/xylan/chitin deacetylase (PgdA/CDA1 family)